jgi:glutamate-1-semialdehyde 2,1-aminomutase
MLAEGIYFSPSTFESGFISSTHGMQEIEFTLAAAEKVFSKLKEQNLVSA